MSRRRSSSSGSFSRLDEPEKNWKFSNATLTNATSGATNDAYEDTIRHTASAKESPWYVVPGGQQVVHRIVVAAAVIDALSSLDLHFPKVDAGPPQGTRRSPRHAVGNKMTVADAASISANDQIHLNNLKQRAGGDSPRTTKDVRNVQGLTPALA